MFLLCVSAILYELLYDCVFGMEDPVRVALEMIDSKQSAVRGPAFSADGSTDKARYVTTFDSISSHL